MLGNAGAIITMQIQVCLEELLQVARHAAVLGTVACALHNPIKQRHHYLAFRGDQEVVNTNVPSNVPGNCRLHLRLETATYFESRCQLAIANAVPFTQLAWIASNIHWWQAQLQLN